MHYVSQYIIQTHNARGAHSDQDGLCDHCRGRGPRRRPLLRDERARDAHPSAQSSPKSVHKVRHGRRTFQVCTLCTLTHTLGTSVPRQTRRRVSVIHVIRAEILLGKEGWRRLISDGRALCRGTHPTLFESLPLRTHALPPWRTLAAQSSPETAIDDDGKVAAVSQPAAHA